MAICTYCNGEMTSGVGCTLPVYDDFRDGVTRRRIVNGSRQACPDCGTPPRGLHHPGCDLERCPSCGRQALTCGCTSSAA
jgi:hypothetical protein